MSFHNYRNTNNNKRRQGKYGLRATVTQQCHGDIVKYIWSFKATVIFTMQHTWPFRVTVTSTMPKETFYSMLG